MSQNTAQWFLHRLSHITGGSDELPIFTPTTSGMVPLAGGDRNLFLRADGTWANPRTSGGTGRNTTPGGLELPTPHAYTHISSGVDPIDIFTSTISGLVPLSGGGSTNFLRADGNWSAPAGSTIPAALTRTNDTNITLTLGGTPSTALLQATSLTLGWTGTLADGRITSASTWNAKVDVSGTPVNNQLAIWTNATTIEGDSKVTWTGTGPNIIFSVDGHIYPGTTTSWNLGSTSLLWARLYTNYVQFIDATTYIWRDGSNNLQFTDAVAGTLTLNQLSTLVGGQNVNALVTSPAVGQDGYAVTWDDGNSEYTLTVFAAGATSFLGLSDTPAVYTAVAEYMVMVNNVPDALEFIDPSGYAINNFSGTLTANWTITGNNLYKWRIESVHAATGSVYAELSNSGKSFNAVSWSADNYTGNYGSLYVDDAEINLTLDNSVNQKIISLTVSAITVTDAISSTGFIYAANYSTAGMALDRWLPDWAAVRDHLGGKDVHTTITNPTVTEDGYVVFWDNTNTRYDLKVASGGGTHAFLSATHTDTATTTVLRGMLITGQVGVQWDGLVISATTTHLLRTDGTDITWGAFNFADLGTIPTVLSGYGISDTKANFNIALSDGDFAFSGGAFHDGFSDFVGDEHFDHTSISMLTASTSGLDGGGTIAANRNLVLNINRLTAITVPADVDQFAIYDSGVGQRKITWADIKAAIPSGGTPGGSDTYVQFNNASAFGGSVNLTWDDYILKATNTATHAAWSDYPTALPTRYSLRAERGSAISGTNNYNGVVLHAQGNSSYDSYAFIGVKAITTIDNKAEFNLMLSGASATDWETVFSARYDSIYYWKTSSVSSDIKHALVQNGTSVAIWGWDDSGAGFQIEVGTAFSSGPAMFIGSNNHVAIGSQTNNATYELHITGEVYSTGDMYATDFNLTSDPRLKNTYGLVSNGLDIVMKLRPVNYRWKDCRNDYMHIGFLTNEVEKVRPELVKYDDVGFGRLSYSKITAINTAAIQNLNYKLETIENKLRKEIIDLKIRIKKLENGTRP